MEVFWLKLNPGADTQISLSVAPLPMMAWRFPGGRVCVVFLPYRVIGQTELKEYLWVIAAVRSP